MSAELKLLLGASRTSFCVTVLFIDPGVQAHLSPCLSVVIPFGHLEAGPGSISRVVMSFLGGHSWLRLSCFRSWI